MTFVDSNVFVIDLRYRRDVKYRTNAEFLRRLKRSGDGATCLINLLEVAGILSHDLDRRRLRALVTHFPEHYGVRLMPPADIDATLPAVPLARMLGLIERKMSFGDALIASEIERHASAGDRFVSWDSRHFEGKLSIPVLSPADAT